MVLSKELAILPSLLSSADLCVSFSRFFLMLVRNLCQQIINKNCFHSNAISPSGVGGRSIIVSPHNCILNGGFDWLHTSARKRI